MHWNARKDIHFCNNSNLSCQYMYMCVSVCVCWRLNHRWKSCVMNRKKRREERKWNCTNIHSSNSTMNGKILFFCPSIFLRPKPSGCVNFQCPLSHYLTASCASTFQCKRIFCFQHLPACDHLLTFFLLERFFFEYISCK